MFRRLASALIGMPLGCWAMISRAWRACWAVLSTRPEAAALDEGLFPSGTSAPSCGSVPAVYPARLTLPRHCRRRRRAPPRLRQWPDHRPPAEGEPVEHVLGGEGGPAHDAGGVRDRRATPEQVGGQGQHTRPMSAITASPYRIPAGSA